MSNQTFTPGASTTVLTSGASQAVALPVPTGVNKQVRTNLAAGADATFAIFVKFGKNNSVVATTADMRVLPGTTEIWSLGAEITHIAVLGNGGANTFQFTTGYGD